MKKVSNTTMVDKMLPGNFHVGSGKRRESVPSVSESSKMADPITSMMVGMNKANMRNDGTLTMLPNVYTSSVYNEASKIKGSWNLA